METINTSIKPDSAYKYTFTSQADLSTSGVYNLKMYVELAGEQNVLNDTFIFFTLKF